MYLAKIFTNGRSQAVRLPKDCRFAEGETEVYVHKMDGLVMLIPKKDPWRSMIHSLDKFTDDFMNKRDQPHQQDSRDNIL